MRILVTGANGSLGRALCDRLDGEVYATDKDTMDVTSLVSVREAFAEAEPDLVYHLAGAKSAPDGEIDPQTAALVNTFGTMNVVEAARRWEAKVVLASTCKAADPETAYGASKLLAEKIVLQAGGVVCRFYNVRETCQNVFEIWDAVPLDEPLPVTPCERYFISSKQAVTLLMMAARLPTGRYAVDPGPAWTMSAVAESTYPGRPQRLVPARRGDRLREPLLARCEWPTQVGSLVRIESPHDPEVVVSV